MAKFFRKTRSSRQTHLGVAYHLHIRVRDVVLYENARLYGV
jgi:hypothetical protein